MKVETYQRAVTGLALALAVVVLVEERSPIVFLILAGALGLALGKVPRRPVAPSTRAAEPSATIVDAETFAARRATASARRDAVREAWHHRFVGERKEPLQ